ncbi:hypothetical protein AJ78_00738 [Emergomyces pasteurianus Ep9510]|uniref:Uncharacterized protein n=1 Tax=Emergomyces pasteurianus Ep9510 TaxID=1447872 RepID=A0A1J9PS93_9EURO|nr:hypothetical protein AJ78_00738 [Emergomyces pasteurianus Ep9510]
MKFTGISAALVLAGYAAASPVAYGDLPKYGVPSEPTSPTPTATPSDVDPGTPTVTPTVTPTLAPTLPAYGIPSVPSVSPELKPSGAPVCSCSPEDITDDTPSELPQVDGLDSNLLAQLLPGLLSIINGLGFGGFAPGLLSLLKLDVVINNLEILNVDALLGGLQVPEISGLSTGQATKVVVGLLSITKVLKLDQVTSGVLPQIDGISPDLLQAIINFVFGLIGKLGLQSVFTTLEIPATTDAPGLLVAGGLLAQLAPLVAGLLNALGLGGLAPLLVTLLNTLSIGL